MQTHIGISAIIKCTRIVWGVGLWINLDQVARILCFLTVVRMTRSNRRVKSRNSEPSPRQQTPCKALNALPNVVPAVLALDASPLACELRRKGVQEQTLNAVEIVPSLQKH